MIFSQEISFLPGKLEDSGNKFALSGREPKIPTASRSWDLSPVITRTPPQALRGHSLRVSAFVFSLSKRKGFQELQKFLFQKWQTRILYFETFLHTQTSACAGEGNTVRVQPMTGNKMVALFWWESRAVAPHNWKMQF